ncbi:hypothetical protein [uncultured Thiodictyon sp.]|uniref:hypothetical protein n=1 Tax=uncultured Thiodictyon sp. TaxID=1846217 RepID=UPI0025D074FE|nr:hypothetical protein [uncultured Thiodictyon sp.]
MCEDYRESKTTYAIWLLGEDLRPARSGYAHRFRMRDEQGRGLLDHGGISVLELGKLAAEHLGDDAVVTKQERWLRYFTEGARRNYLRQERSNPSSCQGCAQRALPSSQPPPPCRCARASARLS